jgi:hypothetical protein
VTYGCRKSERAYATSARCICDAIFLGIINNKYIDLHLSSSIVQALYSYRPFAPTIRCNGVWVNGNCPLRLFIKAEVVKVAQNSQTVRTLTLVNNIPIHFHYMVN